MRSKIEKIEDIYPLTIVSMRYSDNFVIINTDSDAGFISDIQLNEQIAPDIINWLAEHVSPCQYGIGKSVWEAFEDYKKRLYNY